MGKSWIVFILINLLVAVVLVSTTSSVVLKPRVKEYRTEVAKVSVFSKIEHSMLESDQLLEKVSVNGKDYKVKYTLNSKLNIFIRKLLRRYRTDHSVVVVLDNSTGKILSAISYNGKEREFGYNLAFTSTHPAASLFKIVTSAALFEGGHLDVEDKFSYRGKGSTLYKYQLRDKLTRWTRNISFKRAFAFSNNVVMGKAAIKHLTAGEIYKMAMALGFNKKLIQDIDITSSRFKMPTSQYNLAEKASGFNRSTLIGPVHAALISSIVANDGILATPSIVESIKDESGDNLYSSVGNSRRVISYDTSNKLKQLMLGVVSTGTARSIKRRLSRKIKNDLLIGGKTGTITGGIPYGKRDWLTMFAMPKDDYSSGNGISICVMNINNEKWHVKSTYLAKKIVEYYYKTVHPIKKILKKVALDHKNVRGLL